MKVVLDAVDRVRALASPDSERGTSLPSVNFGVITARISTAGSYHWTITNVFAHTVSSSVGATANVPVAPR